MWWSGGGLKAWQAGPHRRRVYNTRSLLVYNWTQCAISPGLQFCAGTLRGDMRRRLVCAPQWVTWSSGCRAWVLTTVLAVFGQVHADVPPVERVGTAGSWLLEAPRAQTALLLHRAGVGAVEGAVQRRRSPSTHQAPASSAGRGAHAPPPLAAAGAQLCVAASSHSGAAAVLAAFIIWSSE